MKRMNRKSPPSPLPSLPARLESARERFERWRCSPDRKRSIPDRLWQRAVKLARVYGLHRTARALRLNSDVLKKRVARQTSTKPKQSVQFLEIEPAEVFSAVECVVELTSARGQKMRIELKGAASKHLEALAKSFWSGEQS